MLHSSLLLVVSPPTQLPVLGSTQPSSIHEYLWKFWHHPSRTRHCSRRPEHVNPGCLPFWQVLSLVRLMAGLELICLAYGLSSDRSRQSKLPSPIFSFLTHCPGRPTFVLHLVFKIPAGHSSSNLSRFLHHCKSLPSAHSALPLQRTLVPCCTSLTHCFLSLH